MSWIDDYLDLNNSGKRMFRLQILNQCGISKRSFYRYLNGFEPNKLIKEKITSTIRK